jgi:hypothetical protein
MPVGRISESVHHLMWIEEMEPERRGRSTVVSFPQPRRSEIVRLLRPNANLRNPFGVKGLSVMFPRVAAARQPWAVLRKPFGLILNAVSPYAVKVSKADGPFRGPIIAIHSHEKSSEP